MRGPFSLDMWKFDDSVKAHLLIPQLVARGYPLEIFGFALVDTQNHRDVFKLATDTATSSLTGCASSILADCLQSCFWARALLFELVQVLGYVVLEHTRFLANARRRCDSGWRFVQQGPDHRLFLQGCGNANMEKSGWTFTQFGHGERYQHRLVPRRPGLS